MGNMTKNFSRSEFDCHCCGLNLTKPRLVMILQAIRDHFDKPTRITSGTRCAKHNRAVKGAKNSQHLHGTAADIMVEGVSPKAVRDYAATLLVGFGGLKAYKTFTHVDIRTGKWRG